MTPAVGSAQTPGETPHARPQQRHYMHTQVHTKLEQALAHLQHLDVFTRVDAVITEGPEVGPSPSSCENHAPARPSPACT